jgi:predicted RNA-binding protein
MPNTHWHTKPKEECTMKKVISLIAVIALVCFTTMVFAADAAKAAVIQGEITNVDMQARQIVVKGKTIVVEPGKIDSLRNGQVVKVTLVAGTMDAEKIEIIKSKKAAKKAAEPAKATVIQGEITNVDMQARQIVVKGKTILVEPGKIDSLRNGQVVKVTLVAGTMDAKKIEIIKTKKAAKKEPKKEVKKEVKKEEGAK